MSLSNTIQKEPYLPQPTIELQKPLLIFSADRDLADSLTMLLEDRYRIVAETQIGRLEEQIRRDPPAIVVIDLSWAPSECLEQLSLLERMGIDIPIIAFRSYRLVPAIDQALKLLRAYVFYKPIELEMVVSVIKDLLQTT